MFRSVKELEAAIRQYIEVTTKIPRLLSGPEPQTRSWLALLATPNVPPDLPHEPLGQETRRPFRVNFSCDLSSQAAVAARGTQAEMAGGCSRSTAASVRQLIEPMPTQDYWHALLPPGYSGFGFLRPRRASRSPTRDPRSSSSLLCNSSGTRRDALLRTGTLPCQPSSNMLHLPGPDTRTLATNGVLESEHRNPRRLLEPGTSRPQDLGVAGRISSESSSFTSWFSLHLL